MRYLLAALILLAPFMADADPSRRRQLLMLKAPSGAGGGGCSFPSGFTAFWKLGDADPHDDFYTGNDMADQFAEPNAPDVVAGKIGNCLEFNGTFDNCQAPDSADLDAGSNVDFTVAGWFMTDTLAATKYIISKATSPNGWEVSVQTSGKLRFHRWAASVETTFDSTGTFTTGVWVHFGVTYDQSNYKIYLNGALDSTHSDSTDIGDDDDICAIGFGTAAGAGYFDGKIDAIGVASGLAMTLTDMQNLYCSGNGIEP